MSKMGLLSLQEIMRSCPRHVLQARANRNGRLFALHQLRFNSQSRAPHTPEAITPSTTLHKPKTTTSLRKAASASQSIRETQTPTRGTIQPVWTLSTAERYSLPRLQSVLGKNATVLAESLWIPNLRKCINGSTGGEAFVFENGCVVSWGVQEEDARRFIQLNMTGRGVELGKYMEEETEEVEFVTDPSEYVSLHGSKQLLIIPKTNSSTGRLDHSRKHVTTRESRRDPSTTTPINTSSTRDARCALCIFTGTRTINRSLLHRGFPGRFPLIGLPSSTHSSYDRKTGLTPKRNHPKARSFAEVPAKYQSQCRKLR